MTVILFYLSKEKEKEANLTNLKDKKKYLTWEAKKVRANLEHEEERSRNLLQNNILLVRNI